MIHDCYKIGYQTLGTRHIIILKSYKASALEFSFKKVAILYDAILTVKTGKNSNADKFILMQIKYAYSKIQLSEVKITQDSLHNENDLKMLASFCEGKQFYYSLTLLKLLKTYTYICYISVLTLNTLKT